MLIALETSLLRRLRADPSQCNSTNRQNPPIQSNGRNFWTNDVLWDLEYPKPVKHSLLYDWKYHLQPLGRDGAIQPLKEKGDLVTNLINEWITTVFVEQPLASPGLLKIIWKQNYTSALGNLGDYQLKDTIYCRLQYTV